MTLAELFDPEFVSLVFIGVGIGVVAALLGIGGGLLMVPTLIIWEASAQQATATSLVGIFLSSTSATFQNWRMGHLKLERVALLAPPAMLATELGVWISNKLPESWLLISFALLQLASIYLITLKRKLKRSPAPVEAPARSVKSMARSQTMARVGKSSPSRQTAPVASVQPDQQEVFPTQGIGLLAGVLSGIFGVGGGIVMVPLQMLFLGEDIKSAVRTSLGAIVLISVWAVGRQALSGNVLWSAGVCLGLGGLIGAQLGARLLPKLPDHVVNLLFRGLLLALATYMVIQAAQRWQGS